MCKNLSKLIYILSLFLFLVHYTVYAQENTSDLKKEIYNLKYKQKELQKNIKLKNELLLKNLMPAPPKANVYGVEFELGDNPSRGSDNAPLALIDFSDYQCTYCAKHTKETFPVINRGYIKTGKLRYIIIDKPLPIHDLADKAEEAAHCAVEQEKFWEIHDKLMSNPGAVYDLNSLASSLNFEMDKFKYCMETEKYVQKAASNISLSAKLKVPSLSGFIIASRDSQNPQKVKGISYIRGAKPFEKFKIGIDQALASLAK